MNKRKRHYRDLRRETRPCCGPRALRHGRYGNGDIGKCVIMRPSGEASSVQVRKLGVSLAQCLRVTLALITP